jgi:hypothetical protein
MINLFNNMSIIKNFYKSYRIKSGKKVFFDFVNFKISLSTKDITENEVKYFKIISYSHFENSINNEIKSKNQKINNLNTLENLTNRSMFSNSYNSSFKNIPNFLRKSNSDLDIKILNKDTQKNLNKYSLVSSVSKKIEINLSEDQKLKERNEFSLDFKIKNIEQPENVYNFFIYAYDKNENILSKWKSDDINVSSLEEYDINIASLEKKEIENIDHLNLFNIAFDRNIEKNINSQNRKISFSKTDAGKNVIQKLFENKYFNYIKNIKIIEYINDQKIDEIYLEIDEIFKKDEIEIIFKKKYEIPEKTVSLSYSLIIENIDKKSFIKNFNYENLNLLYKNKDDFFVQKAKKDIVFVGNSLKENVLGIKIKINKQFKEEKDYNPFVFDIILNKKSILDKVFLEKNLTKPLNLTSQNIKNILSNHEINLYSKLLNLNPDSELSIVFKNRIDDKKIIYTQKLSYEYASISNIENNLISKTQNILKEYTDDVYQYTLNYSTLQSVDQKKTLTNNNSVINQLLKNQDLNQKSYLEKSNSIENLLSNEKKEKILSDINLNKFYLIVKKNIKHFNISQDLLQVLELKDLEESNVILIEDNQKNNNFKENIENYEKINEKYIQFEAKLLSIPSDLFFKEMNTFTFKNRIKEIYLSNNLQSNNMIILSDDIINSLYSIFQVINSKGINSLDNFQIQTLYDFLAINSTWAKSELKEIKRKDLRDVEIEKQINLNSKIEKLFFDNTKKMLKGSIFLNIEQLSDLNLEKDKMHEVIKDITRNCFKGFFYKKDNTKDYPDLSISNVLYKNNKSVFNDWVDDINNSFVDDINKNFTFETKYLNKNSLEVIFYFDLYKTPNMLKLFTFLKNYKEIDFKHEKLYQNIVFNSIDFQIIDKIKDYKKNVKITIKKDQKLFFLYENITNINVS